MLNMTIARELKLIGFFINICASLFLIMNVLFGECKPSLWECIKGEKPWSELLETRGYELANQNKNSIITSALVIIGSSMQMSADLFDP